LASSYGADDEATVGPFVASAELMDEPDTLASGTPGGGPSREDAEGDRTRDDMGDNAGSKKSRTAQFRRFPFSLRSPLAATLPLIMSPGTAGGKREGLYKRQRQMIKKEGIFRLEACGC